MTLLKGAEVAAEIDAGIRRTLNGREPLLAIVRVGAQPDDLAYEKGIIKKMNALGIRADVYEFPADVDEDTFITKFEAINKSPVVDGILCFMPLPKHLDAKKIAEIIDPAKDMDGISPINQAKVYAGDDDGFAPCTAEAVIAILEHYNVRLDGRKVTVVGRSLVIGRPVAMMLMKKNATVTICHTRTIDVDEECRCGEIIVASAGKAKMINADYVTDEAIVIDVGINIDENGKLCGDVDFDDVSGYCKAITPVPGGVGSVTTSILAEHLCRKFQ